MAIQLAEINSLVTQHIRAELPDALMKANFLWSVLADKQAEYIPGGVNIQQPIKLIANSTKGFISGGAAPINVNVAQQFQYMTFNWKYFYTNVSFTLEDFTQTADSPHAVMNFIEKKKEGAKADSIRTLTSALHGSATTDALQFNGLLDIVASSGTAYGGLTDTDYTTGTFLPIIDTTSSAVTYNTFAGNIMKLKARVQQEGVAQSWSVDTGLMNAATMGAFMKAEQNKQRFYEVKKLESGFDGVMINGINVFLDDFTPGSQDGSTNDNYVYFFPKEVLKMCYKYGLKGKTSPFDGDIRIPNQPVESNQVYLAGNLVCTNRRLVYVAKNLIA